MQYFNDASTVSTATNPLLNDLDNAVKEGRSNKKWRHDYMTWKMYGDEKREEGREEGLEEGIDIGLDKGLKALITSLFIYHPNFTSLYNAVCANPDYADVTPEQVHKYYDPLVSEKHPE